MRNYIIAFKNDITVNIRGTEHNYIHTFKVYDKDIFLGTIYFDDYESYKIACDELMEYEGQENPILDDWEDGKGNLCSICGW